MFQVKFNWRLVAGRPDALQGPRNSNRLRPGSSDLHRTSKALTYFISLVEAHVFQE